MSCRRYLSRNGIAHANADSLVHADHVKQRTRSRSVEWVPSIVDDNAASEFRLQADELGLTKGLYFVGFGAEEKEVTGPKFEERCAAVNSERRWNSAQMKRKIKVPPTERNASAKFIVKTTTVRRKRATPACEEFVVNLSPWQMIFLNEQLRYWCAAKIEVALRKELLVGLLNELRPELVRQFQALIQRDVVGSYIHLDSNKIHFAIVHSRVGPTNLLVGEKTLRTVGPWTTAQNRINTLGLVDAADHRLRENLEKFESRYGKDKKPLDIQLHEILDAKFDSIVAKMGKRAPQRFEAAKEHYRKWKTLSRRQSVVRSSSSMTVAYQTLWLLMPLLPPQVRTAVTIARTGVQAFKAINAFLNAAAQTSSSDTLKPKLQLEKTK